MQEKPETVNTVYSKENGDQTDDMHISTFAH